MQGIKVSITYVGTRLDIALISIIGYVDTTTCQELAKVIQNLTTQKRYQIIADLGGVSYISSAGWGVFVGEIKYIRDQGGDLKIVQMNSEVFEVFEMLEFNRILNYYDSLEEAIDEFDIIRGIDITKMDKEAKQVQENGTPPLHYPRPSIAAQSSKRTGGALTPEKQVVLKDLPLMEKIKKIVIENPFLTTSNICRELKAKKYGSVRLSWFRARSILKQLNLENKDKRYRFYRSR
jgi:anti-sigma B factor antagonist